jgi:hypothetical protein
MNQTDMKFNAVHGQSYPDESNSQHPTGLITAGLKIKTVANNFPPNFAQSKVAKNKV